MDFFLGCCVWETRFYSVLKCLVKFSDVKFSEIKLNTGDSFVVTIFKTLHALLVNIQGVPKRFNVLHLFSSNCIPFKL